MASKRRDLSSWLPWLLGPTGFHVNGELVDIARREILNFIGDDLAIEDDPENERTNIRLPTGGGTGTNLGSALRVFKDVAVGALRHRTLRVAGDVSGVEDPAGFPGEVWIRPVPPGHVNVKDYGALGDGVTDDLAAFKTALAAATPDTLFVPPGNYFLSDFLVVRRGTSILGAGFPNDLDVTKLTFAAGKGIILEYVPGTSASIWSHFRNLQLVGAMLTLPLAQTAHVYALGAIARTITNDDNRYYFEIIKAGTSNAAARDFRLAYNPYTGAPRLNTHAYVAGDRVHDMATSTTRFFECTTAGTSAGAPPTWDTTVGHTTTDGGVTWTTRDAAGYFLVDGTAIWACRQASGIWFTIQCIIEDCTFDSFTNGAILGQAHIERNNIDGFFIDNCRFINCGGGFAARGTDSQVGSITRCRAQGSGTQWIAGVGTNHGGFNFWDGSFLGNYFAFCNSQANTVGCPGFILGYEDQRPNVPYDDGSGDSPGAHTGQGGTIVACYDEGDGGACIGVSGFVFGGQWGAGWVNRSTLTMITAAGANNIIAREVASAPKHQAAILAYRGSDTAFALENDDNGQSTSLATGYEPPGLSQPGWWARVFGSSLSGRQWSGATAAEGVGWEWAPFGEYRGGTGASITGRYFAGLDIAAMTTARKTNHHWDVGDRFDLKWDGTSPNAGWIVRTAGYRAPPWPAAAAIAINTSWCEPTANGAPIPTPGGKVFKCHTAGTTDAVTEPTWSTAVNPGDLVPEASGTGVWEYVGRVAEYAAIGIVDSRSVSYSLASADVTMAASDAHVTITANGAHVFKLDPAPLDGKTVEVKAGGAFKVTIDGNGTNIDGAATYTQGVNRENTAFRYNAVVGQWELR